MISFRFWSPNLSKIIWKGMSSLYSRSRRRYPFCSVMSVILMRLSRRRGLMLCRLWISCLGSLISFVIILQCRRLKLWGRPIWLPLASRPMRTKSKLKWRRRTRLKDCWRWPSKCSRNRRISCGARRKIRNWIWKLESITEMSSLELSGSTSLSFR